MSRLCLLPFLVICFLAWRGAAAAEATGTTFDVFEFAVEGNSLLSTIDVERAVYPYLGPGKTIGDVQQARKALEKTYQDAGYLTVLVDIPAQKVEDGVVTLRVVEGRVERLKVSGNRYYERGAIREGVPAMAAGEVPNFNDAQAQLALLSRTPDRKVTPLLRPGKEAGTVEVELKVDDQLPLHGSVEFNNKQSPDTTRNRLEASVHYDNLWQKGHSVGLYFQESPQKPSEVSVLTGTYSLPLGYDTLALYAVRSDSNVATAAASSVLGKGTTLGLRYIHALPPRDSYYHSLSAGFDYKDFKETTNLIGADTANHPIRYVPFSLQYNAGTGGDTGQWRLDLGLTASVRGLSDRQVICDDGQLHDQFDCKRSGAQPNFAVLRGDLERKQDLPGGWRLLGRVDFQKASQPLISNEQFSAGGVDSVRGYLDAEVQGDDGLRGRFEIEHPVLATDWGALRALAFLDRASVSLQDPLPGQKASFNLGSYGVGLRLSQRSGIHLDADVAHANFNGADRAGGGYRTHAGQNRIHARLSYEF